jgi:hypothetical protein
VVLDLGGHSGRVGGSVQVLPGLLPPALAANPELVQIAENIETVYEHDPEETEFDVFISHASEDKASVVEPLAHALQEQRLNVWYDDFVLRIGTPCVGGSMRVWRAAASGSSCSRRRSSRRTGPSRSSTASSP